ncbi:MAG TPA: hypothetical protein VIJ25_11350, partial [Methylococcales bacterium]
MSIGSGVDWARRHARPITYVVGSFVISTWTLLRFFNQRTIFDLVSQQVIVHQWLHGAMSSAHLGLTHYVPKMLLLYVPLDLLPGSPRLKLILLTLFVNIVTFVLLGLVLEKILRHFDLHVGLSFYGALLWLAAISGSVFWIEFTNSRNLEVVGGIYLLYLGLRFLQRSSWRLGLGLGVLSGLLFYADTLQLYMIGLPLVVFGFVLIIKQKEVFRTYLQLLVWLGVGLLISRLLFALSGHFLHLSFTETGSGSTASLSISPLVHGAVLSVKSFVTLFAGAADAGKLREVANLSVLVTGVGVFVYSVVKKCLPLQFVLLLATIFITDELVYVASGQALQAGSSRYLIMLAPTLV